MENMFAIILLKLKNVFINIIRNAFITFITFLIFNKGNKQTCFLR